MHIYFSGIGGVGIGPLAQIALDAGYEVSGSDLQESALTESLVMRGANVFIGQDGSQIAGCHDKQTIDWVVYTSALPFNHPELAFVREKKLKNSKRDELLAKIIEDKKLKLLAVAGTHGKTTTTSMLVWLFKQAGVPVSYSVGTTISFGPSGQYQPNSEYFVYECDEYDYNFLHFYPHASIITAVDYDHYDCFSTVDDYKQAFRQFMAQSDNTLLWQKDEQYLEPIGPHVSYEAFDDTSNVDDIKLPGHNRKNGFLALQLASRVIPHADVQLLLGSLNDFPGSARRFEKLADNIYSDYGHTPAEIASTLQLASELSDQIVLVYQPHQNNRQHHVRKDYKDSMKQAEHIYWLPTYLSRENPNLAVLSPQDLIAELSNKQAAEPAEMDEGLWKKIQAAREAGKLVLGMGAGSIDSWLRQMVATSTTRQPDTPEDPRLQTSAHNGS